MTTLSDDFDDYVRSRTPALLRTAYLLTGDRYLAEDLVQAALIRTHRAWRRLRDGNPDAYTRKVMYHLQIAWWRRNRVPESLAPQVPEPAHVGPDGRDLADLAVARLTTRVALRKLTPKQRAVLVLRFFDDHTEAEAADLLGVAVGTVKSQTAKALARLRVVAPELVNAALSEGVTS